MLEQLLAGLVALVCIALLVRLLLPARLRWRVDAAARAAAEGVRSVPPRLRRLARRKAERDEAARAADEIIRRARGGKAPVDREGNVYRPRSFRDRRDLH